MPGERSLRGIPEAATKKGARSPQTLAIVGLGRTGLSLASLARASGFRVLAFDPDEVRIAQLGLQEEAGKDPFGSLTLSSEESTLTGADIFIISTKLSLRQKRSADLEPLERACTIVSKRMNEGALVVIETDVPLGACENIALPVLVKGSGLSAEEFSFAHCPIREDLLAGRALADIPRAFGARNDEALQRTRDLYHALLSSDLLPLRTIKESEAVALLSKGFREVNIALVDELAIVFDKIGVDIVNVIEAASADPSFSAQYPSAGERALLPQDPFYLIRYGRDKGFEHQLLTAARRVRARMPNYVIRILSDSLDDLKLRLEGASVALLGLTASRDSSELEESPTLELRNGLIESGAEVKVFDPLAGAYSERTLEDALKDCVAAIIATDHSLFDALGPKVFENAGIRVVIDGHNRLDRRAFLESSVRYRGIGRG